MAEQIYEFKVGDRVDFSFFEFGGQGTPGRVVERKIHDGSPAYRVAWDDGFAEDPTPSPVPSANAYPLNWWPEGSLVREGQ